MSRQIVHTDRAPAAIGPYSQAVVSRGVVSTAGQIPIDPETGELVGAGDIKVQARQALTNVKEILLAAGSGMGLCLRCSVFMTDLADFDAMNEVYAEFFTTDPPARITVQVAALPMGAAIEISALAMVLE